MKLRNKKTGDIKEVIVAGYPVTGKIKMWECSEMDANEEIGYKSLGTYTSLANLNDEWEDYEEPKKYWFIDAFGNIVQNEITKHLGDEYTDMSKDYENQKQIGNYFETKEEAEQAVEKLKAWKRLKDKGFSFIEWEWNIGTDEMVHICTNLTNEDIRTYQAFLTKDLDLLIGCEE